MGHGKGKTRIINNESPLLCKIWFYFSEDTWF